MAALLTDSDWLVGSMSTVRIAMAGWLTVQSNSWPRKISSLVAGSPSLVLSFSFVLFTEVVGQNLRQKAWVVGTYKARGIFSQRKELVAVVASEHVAPNWHTQKRPISSTV